MFGTGLSNNEILSEDLGGLFNGCSEPKGLKVLHIGLGKIRF